MAKNNIKLIQEISNFRKSYRKLLKDVGEKFASTKGIAVVLPEIQLEEVRKTYLRFLDEILAIIDISSYLKEELNNKESDIYKSYYHIDNFYHRLYVLEEMYYRLISKIFLHRTKTDRTTIENELSSFGYKELNRLISNFNKDKDVKSVRKRRKELVHRTDYSARELVTLWTRWDGTKRHIYGRSKDSEKRFCRKECEKISNTTAKYIAFTTK